LLSFWIQIQILLFSVVQLGQGQTCDHKTNFCQCDEITHCGLCFSYFGGCCYRFKLSNSTPYWNCTSVQPEGIESTRPCEPTCTTDPPHPCQFCGLSVIPNVTECMWCKEGFRLFGHVCCSDKIKPERDPLGYIIGPICLTIIALGVLVSIGTLLWVMSHHLPCGEEHYTQD